MTDVILGECDAARHGYDGGWKFLFRTGDPNGGRGGPKGVMLRLSRPLVHVPRHEFDQNATMKSR